MTEGKIQMPVLEAFFRQATLAQIVTLRGSVLRAGLPIEFAYFEGDYLSTTQHFAMRTRRALGDRTLCCASFMLSHWEEEPAWQLRGMATDPEFQGRGLGTVLLRGAEGSLHEVEPDIHLLWCHAQVPAVAFYLRNGWRCVSEVFDIEGVGLHRKMTKEF